jgi:hypothetical protein
MPAHGQFHRYRKSTLIALIIGCVISDLLFIIPMVIVIGSNGTTSDSLSLTDSLLFSLAGWGFLILFIEVIIVMARDWQGAMTLRFSGSTVWVDRSWRARRARYWLFPLYIIVPYIILPIYLVRVVMDQCHVAQMSGG